MKETEDSSQEYENLYDVEDMRSGIDVKLARILLRMGSNTRSGDSSSSVQCDALELVMDRVLTLHDCMQLESDSQQECNEVKLVTDNVLKIITLLLHLERVDATEYSSDSLPSHATRMIRGTQGRIVDSRSNVRSFFFHDDTDLLSPHVSLVEREHNIAPSQQRNIWNRIMDDKEIDGPYPPAQDTDVHVYMTESGDEEFDVLYRK